MTQFDKVQRIGMMQPGLVSCDASRFNRSEYVMFPGFCDVHVHFREPGFSYKETIRTGSAAAAAAGYTAVCTMPNLNPVPDSPGHLLPQLEKIREVPIRVLPYGSITEGEKGERISDLEGLAPDVVGFSDDGVGVRDDEIMREAMQRCRVLGKLIAAHCEDMRFDAPREREWREVERNIRLSDETGCALHICHVSTRESVSLIRDAKKSGVNVTCETAPHYLLLNRSMMQEDGRFWMNPPIQEPEDQAALLESLQDGTVDMIATDHAPHTAEEKRRGARGILGLETAFPVLYTGLVQKGVLTLEALVALLSARPRARFGISDDGDFTVWNLNTETVIDPASFRSLGRSTPFEGWHVKGTCLLTVHGGTPVYSI